MLQWRGRGHVGHGRLTVFHARRGDPIQRGNPYRSQGGIRLSKLLEVLNSDHNSRELHDPGLCFLRSLQSLERTDEYESREAA